MTVPKSHESPELGHAVDLADFISALAELRERAGSPSYRALAKAVGPMLRPPREVAFRTVAAVFEPDRRRLDMDLVLALVRVLSTDERQVAVWREAYLRVLAGVRTGAPNGVLRQLPADLLTFTGRAEHLRRLAGVTAGSGRPGTAGTMVVCAIEGMAGVGKTSLAIHLAHRLVEEGRYADAQFYVNLRGFDRDHRPTEPVVVLESLLRQLGVPPQRIPDSLDERAAMFRDRTHALDALILLDNAASVQQIRELIPSGPGCLTLVTSRRTLIGLERDVTCELDVFSGFEALNLLRRIAGPERIDAEPEAAAELAGLCGALPLAVALAGGRLRSRPAWSVAELCRRLRERGLTAVGSEGDSLSVLFDLSYGALPAQARRLFRLLSLSVGAEFTAPMAAALSDVEPGDAEAVLDQLQDDHLLWETLQGRYELHDLLRSFAAECANRDEPEEEQSAATERLLSWFLHSADAAACTLSSARRHVVAEQIPPGRGRLEFADQSRARAWLDREYHTLLAAHSLAARTQRDEFAALLPRTLWEQFSRRGGWRDWLEACRDGIEAARRLCDQKALTRLLLDQGSAYFQARQYESAVTSYREAAALAGERGDLDALATASVNLGQTLVGLGRVEEGEAHIRTAVSANTESGNRHGQAAAHTGLASAAFHRSSYATALEHQLIALSLWQELKDANYEAIGTVNVGHALERLGRLDEAADTLKRGIELNHAIGNGLVEASAWEYLAEVRGGQQDRPGAVEAYTAARALLVGVDDTRAEGLAQRIAGAQLKNRDDQLQPAHSTSGRG